MFFVFALLFSAAPARADDVYDRVMERGEIRCGYFLWQPVLMKDPVTGEMSGIIKDATDDIARRLSLDVEWVTEVNFATMLEDLKNGRYDMICGPLAVSAARARQTRFLTPFAYSPTFLYARIDDARFDHNFAVIDDPDIRTGGFEGEFGAMLLQELYPQASFHALPHLSDASQVILEIVGDKIDVAAIEPAIAEGYIAANPGKLKRIPGGAVRVSPIAYAVAPQAERFQDMMNVAVREMIDTGAFERLLAEYPALRSFIYLPANPWEVPE